MWRKDKDKREESFKLAELQSKVNDLRDALSQHPDTVYTRLRVFDVDSRPFNAAMRPIAQSEELRFMLHVNREQFITDSYKLSGDHQQRAIGMAMAMDILQEMLDAELNKSWDQGEGVDA